MTRIEKKAWPEQFQAVLDGRKTFDLRLQEFEAQEGDVLLLREWDPEKKEYTGRSIEKIIGFVLRFKPSDLPFWSAEDVEKHGLQVLSLR